MDCRFRNFFVWSLTNNWFDSILITYSQKKHKTWIIVYDNCL